MVFITTGQRIATENFADGVIYKVTFVDTTISYMMCVGIGQDFVMLQGPNPSLFCLTMSSASRVSTIDVHDPTPPEPPTPIENALQYQTGEPPFTFTTTESSLFSWYIEGPCGVKTANLFDEDYPNISSSIQYLPVYVGDFTVTMSTTCPRVGSAACLWLLEGDVSSGASGNNNVYEGMNRTVTAIDGYITIAYRTTGGVNPSDYKTMLNLGQTALPYEKHGLYKISILSNENAETIYLDEALAEGERLYSVNIDTVVVTDIGENTLSVTPTPPEMQIVYGIYAEA